MSRQRESERGRGRERRDRIEEVAKGEAGVTLVVSGGLEGHVGMREHSFE